MDVNAVLVRSPRTLHQLWDEYIKGIGNNKPAKDFTRLERGRHKFVYCRRKIVWDVVANLVRAGVPASEAIGRIYNAYGANKSVTTIINAIKKDKKDRRLPHALRGV